MLLSLDGTLVVQLVNFLIFLVVLNAIFLKPVGAAIAKRRAYINAVAADIEQFDADVRSLRKQADERRAAARREADAVMAQARAEAQNQAAQISADYQAQATRIIEAAHADVAREMEGARANEDRIVESLADDLLTRAIGVAA